MNSLATYRLVYVTMEQMVIFLRYLTEVSIIRG